MKSSKNKIIAIIILIILFLLFLFMRNKPEEKVVPTKTTTNNVQKQETQDDDQTSMSGTMLDLLKAGKNLQCTYSGETGDIKMEGTSYISGQKMRTDSKTELADGQMLESYMISDGDWLYTWTSESNQGMKMKISEISKDANELSDDTSKSADVSKNAAENLQNDYDFNCKKWIVTGSMFEVPENIEFVDFSQVMEGVKGNACAACNYMQDAASKTQCLESLQCPQ